jgi:hypothetical protein
MIVRARYLFGQPGAQCPVSCNVRFVEVRPKMLSPEEALRLHVMHGVWQCASDHVRNGPQVRLYCVL